jgi:hypothetical protein
MEVGALRAALEVVSVIEVVVVEPPEGREKEAAASQSRVAQLELLLRRHVEDLPAEATGVYAVNQTADNLVHRLSVRQKILYKRSEPAFGLSDRVITALTAATSAVAFGGRVPPETVNSILEDHAARSACTHRIYVLWPGMAGTRKDVRYNYGDPDGAGCGALGWLGGEEGCRYAWFDLGAYAEGWGGNGRGSVPPGSLPQRSLADVAALVHRTAMLLMTHSLLLLPGRGYLSSATAPEVALESSVSVRIWVVCEAGPCPADSPPGDVLATAGGESWVVSPEIDIEEMLNSAKYFGPRPNVAREFVSFEQEPHLAAAFQDSLRTDENGSRFVDAAALRLRLQIFLHGRDEVQSSTRAVDFFAFRVRVSGEALLLDGLSTCASYGDMAFSVSSLGMTMTEPDGVSHGMQLHCGGRILSDTTPIQVSRCSYSALLQTLWGVRPRHLAWESLGGKTDADFLWATAASLHTPLSLCSEPTFVEKDAYPRAMLLAAVDAIASRAETALERASTSADGAEFKTLLPYRQWNAVSSSWDAMLKEVSRGSHPRFYC